MPHELQRPLLPALTSVRFLAACSVMLYHLGVVEVLRGPNWYESMTGVGYVGVSFFFVLSGFILVYSHAGRKISRARFWRSRFARIYPACLFSLVLALPFFVHAGRPPVFISVTAHMKLAPFL